MTNHIAMVVISKSNVRGHIQHVTRTAEDNHISPLNHVIMSLLWLYTLKGLISDIIACQERPAGSGEQRFEAQMHKDNKRATGSDSMGCYDITSLLLV